MMKKKYVIPNTLVVEVDTEGLMLAESLTTDGGASSEGDIEYGGNGVTGEDDQWTPNRPSNSKSFNVWE